MVQGLARAIERTTNLIKFSHNLRIIESLKRNSEDNLIPNKKCTICGKIKYFEHIIGGGVVLYGLLIIPIIPININIKSAK